MTSGAILLAAGNSSRLGEPKQLLRYRGKTLLRHAIDEIAPVAAPLVVVLGADAEWIAEETAGSTAYTAINPLWQEGMASSIRCGLAALLRLAPEIESCFLAVCDQPALSTAHLQALHHAAQANACNAAASLYDGILGVPAWFNAVHFSVLAALQGDHGARSVLRNLADVASVDFPVGALDIDTPEQKKLLDL